MLFFKNYENKMEKTLTNRFSGVKFNQIKRKRCLMKCCEFFNWACKFLKPITENEFNKGYATGVCVVLAVVLLMLIVKIIFKLIFRRHRCHEVYTSSADGDVAITVNAIEDTVRAELNAFPSVRIIKIRLYRVRKIYMLNLICEYDGKDGGLPQITQKVKAALSAMFQNFFGVNSIRRINLKFERLTQVKEEAAPVPAEQKVELTAVSDEKENSDVSL